MISFLTCWLTSQVAQGLDQAETSISGLVQNGLHPVSLQQQLLLQRRAVLAGKTILQYPWLQPEQLQALMVHLGALNPYVGTAVGSLSYPG